MKNFSTELIAMVKTAKSVEELFELVKSNNIEITEEEAKTYFEQINANGVVSDDELDAVAGGFGVVEDLKKVWESRATFEKTLSKGSGTTQI